MTLNDFNKADQLAPAQRNSYNYSHTNIISRLNIDGESDWELSSTSNSENSLRFLLLFEEFIHLFFY